MNKNDKVIYLTYKDAQVFFEALDKPTEANNKLKNAVRHYRAIIIEQNSETRMALQS